jgi:hypothetical protein
VRVETLEPDPLLRQRDIERATGVDVDIGVV